MQSTGLSLSWDEIEVAPGVYDPDPDYLAISNAYYSAAGTSLMLALNPIDTNNERVPAHLDGLAWDDPLMIDAFEDMLDWALPSVVDVDLVALSIGNEIDATLAVTGEWAAYERFFQEVAEHARSLRPGLRVGAKVTVDGLVDYAAAPAASLNTWTDVVLTTYYPLGTGFSILPPTTVRGVFDEVVAHYPTRTILFAEIGLAVDDDVRKLGSAPSRIRPRVLSRVGHTRRPDRDARVRVDARHLADAARPLRTLLRNLGPLLPRLPGDARFAGTGTARTSRRGPPWSKKQRSAVGRDPGSVDGRKGRSGDRSTPTSSEARQGH